MTTSDSPVIHVANSSRKGACRSRGNDSNAAFPGMLNISGRESARCAVTSMNAVVHTPMIVSTNHEPIDFSEN